MEYDKTLLIRLRDCFIAGYTLPQYCIDNGIKKPLLVSEGKYLKFLWEIYVRFTYDKRITPRFSVLDKPSNKIMFGVRGIIGPLTFKNFFDINPEDFDAIILLTTKKVDVEDKVITLAKLTEYFVHEVYIKIPLLNFLQRYPQVKLIVTKFPSVKQYEGGEEFNEQLLDLNSLRKMLRNDKSGTVKTPLDKFGYTNEEVLKLLEAPQVITNLDGVPVQKDDDHPLIKIRNGKRTTAYQPEHFQNRIYFVGSCHDYGINAPYDKTIASYLQKMLNENNLPYRVENESQQYWNRYQDIFYTLNNLTPAPGDIIFVWFDNRRPKNFPFLDMSNVFNPPPDYKDFFCVKGHFNELAYKVLAEKFFKFLTKHNFLRDTKFNYPAPPPVCHRYGIPQQFESGGGKAFVNEGLEAYKKSLREKRVPIGALVMNCNPFTLGHLHLVEYAAARVTKLYIFVVEEDKSEFRFADRIELVRQGVKNFSNVEVLPTGKFFATQQTFSDYFNKANLQDVQIDPSKDIEVFVKEIAPTLGITIRFAGEEPLDNVTRQFNEIMKETLPRHGVDFCVIPRKYFGDEPISASIVRKALKRGDFDKIKNLVPDTTLMYLRGRYSMTK